MPSLIHIAKTERTQITLNIEVFYQIQGRVFAHISREKVEINMHKNTLLDK